MNINGNTITKKDALLTANDITSRVNNLVAVTPTKSDEVDTRRLTARFNNVVNSLRGMSRDYESINITLIEEMTSDQLEREMLAVCSHNGKPLFTVHMKYYYVDAFLVRAGTRAKLMPY